MIWSTIGIDHTLKNKLVFLHNNTKFKTYFIDSLTSKEPQNSRFRGRMQLEKRAVNELGIEIMNLQLSDSGTYTCQFISRDSTKPDISSDVTLFVWQDHGK